MERKRKRNSFSIVSKLRIAGLIPFALFLVAVLFIVAVRYRQQAEQTIIERLENADSIMAHSLEASILNAERLCNTIIIYSNEFLEGNHLSGEKYLAEDGCPIVNGSTLSRLYSCMIDTFTTFHDRNQVLIIWNNGVEYFMNWTENHSLRRDGDQLMQELNELGIDRKGRWLREIESTGRKLEAGPYFVKAYSRITTGERTGYILLKMKDTFSAMEDGGVNRRLYLFDPDGTCIWSTEPLISQEELFSAAFPKTDYVHVTGLHDQWSLVSVTDMGGEMGEIRRTIRLIVLALFASAVLLWLLTNLIMNRIILPIKQLSMHLEQTGNDLPSPVENLKVDNDEIGVLVDSYNTMVRHNNRLVAMLLEEKKHQENLKYSLLQSQIKPHFLYNSLDTIYCLSEMGKREEASRMTKLLSEYYRHVLHHGLEWVFLSEEVRQTENYLKLQEIRYRDCMDYEIHYGENVEETKVPKLTLQPLVENAIYHGIRPKGEKGKLLISVEQTPGFVEVRIRDNGAGMSEETFRKMLDDERPYETGFGLKAVYERLKFYCGNDSRMELEEVEEGTSLLICLPVSDENGYGEE